MLLEIYGCLYKHHEQPITFLYNTLHYYENNLREKSALKRNFVYTMIQALKYVQLTEPFMAYCARNNQQLGGSAPDEPWNPGPEYYKNLVSRLVESLSNKLSSSSSIDFRFNEFPNNSTFALNVACVELLALPGNPVDIANNLINVVLLNHKFLPRTEIESWINALALILNSLPESYSCVINDRIIDLFHNPTTLQNKNLFHLIDFKNSHAHMNEFEISYLIALFHSYYSHASVGRICGWAQFLKEKVKPVIKNEEQFIFICYLVGPFLHRFTDRTRFLMDITLELYEMLEIIDKKCTNLVYMDTICDLLYHNKCKLLTFLT